LNKSRDVEVDNDVDAGADVGNNSGNEVHNEAAADRDNDVHECDDRHNERAKSLDEDRYIDRDGGDEGTADTENEVENNREGNTNVNHNIHIDGNINSLEIDNDLVDGLDHSGEDRDGSLDDNCDVNIGIDIDESSKLDGQGLDSACKAVEGVHSGGSITLLDGEGGCESSEGEGAEGEDLSEGEHR